MYQNLRILPAGDQAVVVELGDGISEQINQRVRDLTVALDRRSVPGIYDLLPTYRSLMVFYDPMTVSYQDVTTAISEAFGDERVASDDRPMIVHIPTSYGGEHGPDLESVAQNAGLTTQEVIDIHSGIDYLVYMMGFAPGFPYLGGLDERLHTPRLTTPRMVIPPGSVAIAESQTGVYPIASPGGWRLIGRTPVAMFDPSLTPPALLSTGSYIRFVPISNEEYEDIKRKASSGEYNVVTEPKL